MYKTQTDTHSHTNTYKLTHKHMYTTSRLTGMCVCDCRHVYSTFAEMIHIEPAAVACRYAPETGERTEK